MNAMIEILESRTLLSAAPVAFSFAAMQFEPSLVVSAAVNTSPVGTYAGTHASTRGHGSGTFTFVIRQWNPAAGTMQFKLIEAGNPAIRGTGTISGRNFTFRIPEANKVNTLTGTVNRKFTSIVGTYVNKTLAGVVRDRGNFAASR